jgi:hypothetical protein
MRTLGPGSVSSFLKMILDVAFVALWAVFVIVCFAALGALLLSFNPDLLREMTFDGAEDLPKGPLLAGAVASGAVYVGGILMIVARLRRMFATLTAGDPFHPDNVRRLRFIAAVLAGLEIGRYVFRSIAMALQVGDKGLGFTLTSWFSVLVVLVLAEVFREGARLRRDAELTI